MLLIGDNKKEPQRITLLDAVPGDDGDDEAWILMSPITPAMRRRALRAARSLLEGVKELGEVGADRIEDIGEQISRELMRLGALDWGGIGGPPLVDGRPTLLPLTPDRQVRMDTANAPDRPTGTIDDLLDDENVFALLDIKYVVPDAIRRAEKNGLSASSSGTGGAGTPARGIARSAAKPKPKAAAKNARTPKMPSKRPKAKASGTS